MVTQLFTFIIIVWGSAVALWLVVTGIGAFWYDAAEIHRQRRVLRSPNARRYRPRPLISVIITAHNAETTVGRCLQTLAASNYRKLEIIVIDQASTDATRTVAKACMRRYPSRRFRLVNRQLSDDRRPALEHAVQRYARGEILLFLDAAAEITPEACHRAIERFNDQPELQLLQPNVYYPRTMTMVGLFQQYRQFMHYRLRKYASVTQAAHAAPLNGLFVRRQQLTSLLDHGQHGVGPQAYGHNVIIHAQPVTSFGELYVSQQRWLRQHLQVSWQALRHPAKPQLLRLPTALLGGFTALLTPIIVSYFIFLAVQLREPTLLLVSWAVLIGLLVIAAWGDQQLSVRRKVGYIAGLPLSFVYFYAMSFAALPGTLKALRGLRAAPTGERL
jgi:cellulose synthase/poly-beta-1,6-N-acetylglucosamine synthase-like glycosyltransferase